MDRNLNIEAMLASYLDTALWSSVGDDGMPLDDTHFTTDFTPQSVLNARADCRDFVHQCTEAGLDLDTTGLSSSNIGHDLWLTRNRHGAGFWDRGLGDLGERLTKIAIDMGAVDICVGDDNKLGIG